ncbi:MAG: hypothetical protein U5L03_10170 [Burkholderiaceae bacterium]|nr:hypothetical protein [Burkholderiaceae bacterium]
MNFATARTLPATTEAKTDRGRSRGTWRGLRLLRRWWSRVARPAERIAHGSGTPAGCSGPCPSAPVRAAATLAQRRAEAMRRLYPKLSSFRAAPSYGERLTATYASLAAASDLDDLERRLRQLELARGAGPGAQDRALSFC